MHSILSEEPRCFICGSCRWLERHHIMGASNKKKSEKYGLMVYLCHYCHNEPPNGVHHNKKQMDLLRATAQRKFEEVYPDLNWLSIFGKNYI